MTRQLLAMAVFAGLVALTASGCSRASQIGSNEETFAAVDALYTAVTTRRPDLLEQCKQNLARLKDQGHLPPAPHDELAQIIAQAEKGEWRPAAEQLYSFMRQQRKDN